MFQLRIIELTIHLKSGSALKARVRKLTRTVNANDLVGLEWEGGRMPFYHRLADISAIETRRILNWRKGFLK